MDEVIVRSLQGTASRAELGRMRDWREASPENERKYREMLEIWSVTGVAAPDPPIAAPPPTRALIERAEDAEDVAVVALPVGSQARPAPRRAGEAVGPHRRRFRAAVLMAVAAGTAALAFGLGRAWDGPAPPPVVQSGLEVSTGPSELTTVGLAGGTSVRLGPNSTLRMVSQDADGNQTVWLDGRAFFGVVPDPTRTFTVNTPYGDAVALGTRFEVRTEAEEFRVLVVQGVVSVTSAGAELELGPGLMSSAAPGLPPEATAIDDPAAELDWMGLTLVFRATPLDEAAEEIARRYGVDVDLSDSTLAPVEITATFSGQPLERVVGVVCQILNAECAVEGERVDIGSRAGPQSGA